MNNAPYAIPIYLTASGISNMYFSGIAIPSNNKKEGPSK